MADRDAFAPLTPIIVRGLNDKLYEKRKAAAIEVEKLVGDFIASEQRDQMEKLLRVLSKDFALSSNQNARKGGLIGLAAMAIAMQREAAVYVNELVQPVLASFNDQDSRIRYYAIEALYNVAKVTRGAILTHFNEIFDSISKSVSDPDQNVKKGIELLDRLLKDIVAESSAFNLVKFIPLLRERIYTKNPFARLFIVSWISMLDSVPDINLLVFLPEFLDGLFLILGDSNPEIQKSCDDTLNNFLRNLSTSPVTVNYSAMTNILIVHSQSPDRLIQYTAITWLKEFVQLSGRQMLHFTSGLISAIVPCLAYDETQNKHIKDVARVLNKSLKRLISPEDDIEVAIVEEHPGKNEASKEFALDTVETSLAQTHTSVIFDVQVVLRVLTNLLSHEAKDTRISALRWLWHLLKTVPNKTFRHIESVFPILIEKLSDPSEEVVLLILESLAEVSSNPAGHRHPPQSVSFDSDDIAADITHERSSMVNLNNYFTKFINKLTGLFRRDPGLLDDKGSFIIRHLCVLLNAEDIFRSLSERLLLEEDLPFACTMVRMLNSILLTSTELYSLRRQLKDLQTQESCQLFCCLYKTWCHSPVGTVSLCYLTQNYDLAYDITLQFGNLEVTVELLKEVDKLIQLVESPIFAYMRLQLLDVYQNQSLINSLYGLLMLLPQSDAFKLLHHRLQCIPQHYPRNTQSKTTKQVIREHVKTIDFKRLRELFISVQEKHSLYRMDNRKLSYSSEES